MRSPEQSAESIVDSGLTFEAPPGGKALERLSQFDIERGLADAGAAAPESGDGPRVFDWSAALAETDDVTMGRAGLTPPLWRPLGPTFMRDGQTYGTGPGSRVDVCGRVAAIAVDPADGRHILVGAAGGGVWETRDTGATWRPRGDGLPTLAVGALCFDPGNSAIAYLGSGEGDFYAGLGQGVFRSTDGGRTWTLRAGTPFVGVGFYALVVDPADSARLYAATRGGLYTSDDSGATWTQRVKARCWSVSVHPAGGATEVLAACSGGLLRSTDSGATWASVALTGIPAPVAIQGRLAVSHSPVNGGVAWVWGATDPNMVIPGTNPPQSQQTPRLWRRASTGDAFTAVPVDTSVRTGQAWYDWHVHAAADDVVYVGEINLFRVDRAAQGTVTWTNLSSKNPGDSIHPDQHALAFDPGNRDIVYAGCDGGIYRSPNRGTNWADLNDGLAITEIEYLAQDVGAARWLLAGTQDNGCVRFVGSPVWDHVDDGDGGDCASSTADPARVYHSRFRMGVFRSSDRGDTWTWVPTGDRDPSVYGQLFYPPMEANGATIAQAGESVFISRDYGVSFSEVALPGRAVASAMYMPSPDRVFVGTSGGRLFRIDWSRSGWSAPAELTSPRSAYLSDLYADPADNNRMWATSSEVGGGRVFRSTDGGSTWTDRTAGLPALPVNAIEVPPNDPNRVWVAADKGVYQSRDAGATWSGMSSGLPNCIIADLLYHEHSRVLRAGTRNRGVWECDIERLENPVCGVQWTGALAPHETRRWFTFNWPASWHVVWTVMPTTVLRGAPEIGWDVQVERADAQFATYWITVRNLTGRRITFEGRYAILGYR